jgi:hypothetical protein
MGLVRKDQEMGMRCFLELLLFIPHFFVVVTEQIHSSIFQSQIVIKLVVALDGAMGFVVGIVEAVAIGIAKAIAVGIIEVVAVGIIEAVAVGIAEAEAIAVDIVGAVFGIIKLVVRSIKVDLIFSINCSSHFVPQG